MRNGRLLTEKSPQALLDEFKVPHLEDIVVSLCRIDRDERKKDRHNKEIESPKQDDQVDTASVGKRTIPSISNWLTTRKIAGNRGSTTVEESGVIGLRYESSLPTSVGVSNSCDNNNGMVRSTSTTSAQLLMRRRKMSTRENLRQSQSTTSRRLLALLIKNFIILMRNVGFLLFVFLVPSIQVVLICLTIGSDPKGLLIGVINPEVCDFEGKGWRRINETCPVESKDDDENGTLSCFYLSHLPTESFILVFFVY